MRDREEEPIAEACDFGVVYSLFLRLPKGAPRRNPTLRPRVILKVSWELESVGGETKTCGCAFELDLIRERMTALGRKGHTLPPERFPAPWFCAWARREIRDAE